MNNEQVGISAELQLLTFLVFKFLHRIDCVESKLSPIL